MEGAGGCYEIKTAIFQFTSSEPVFVPGRKHSDTSSISEIFKQSVNPLNENFYQGIAKYKDVLQVFSGSV